MLQKFYIDTKQEGLINITEEVREAVTKSGINEGICTVFSPHTTAGITINENADPDVVKDLLFGMSESFPDRPEFMHAEGNSFAHIKASCIGASENIIISERRMVLGIWQAIYFCEFDGPRKRKFYVKVVGE